MQNAHDIHYRPLRRIDDLHQVVDLQHLVWGEEAEAIVPLNMLYSLAANGNPIIGAFDGQLLVGFSLAFFGLDLQGADRPAMSNLKLASKRLAVHPDYRSAGIGYQLKLEQKAFADQQGVSLITWTFNPLVSRNAYLNLHKLGAMGRQFIPDYFGDIFGQTDSLGYSDRLICEWWLRSNRVQERLHGSRPALTAEQYVLGNAQLINPIQIGLNDLLMPYEGEAILGENHLLLVEIPSDINNFSLDPSLAKSWREHIRSVFEQTFAAGYIVTDFLYEVYEGRQRSLYVMGFDGGVTP